MNQEVMVSSEPLKILVKLPVKLGDTIMAAYFLRAVKKLYPNCQLHVVIANGLTELLSFMPYVDDHYKFSKREYPGPIGNYKFGKLIRSKFQYDIFFCLPFSFSSALAGFFTNSKERIGYKKEHRGFLFTSAIKRPEKRHIVEEFVYLLEEYAEEKVELSPLNFKPEIYKSFELEKKILILNIKSGPPSRSIPSGKAVEIVNDILNKYHHQVVLTGAPNEANYISRVKEEFREDEKVLNLAGKTSIPELFFVISKADCMITTDSGNAHVANAVGTPTVVLFGAAHEHRAKPFDQTISRTLRLREMECVPCESEHCKYADNRCLSGIGNDKILAAVDSLIKN